MRDGHGSRCHSSRYSSVSTGPSSLLPLSILSLHPLSFLSPRDQPRFSLSSAVCLQRRRHLRFAPWRIVSGYVRACSSPRNIRDTCRLSPPSWHRFPPRERIRRGIEDWIECPRRSILGTRDSRSSYLELSLPAVQGWTGAFQMHLCAHAPRRSIHRRSDRSRSLYRINYNVHRSRTCIAIRSMRVPSTIATLFNYLREGKR